METILVTGGLGYIGSHTVLDLVKSGYGVVILDNLSNAKIEVIDKLELLTGKKIPLYIGDILDKEILKKIFSEHNIYAIMHFAGLKAVGESVMVPLKYYYNNISGTVSLLEVAKEFNCKNFIFSSSATVYGSQEVFPIKETAPLNEPTNPYGKTKLFIEYILKDLYNSDKDWNIILLRYFNPIGADKSGLIGEEPNGIPNNLMPYITQVAFGKREILSVFGSDYDTHDGTGVRDYIHVTDLARGHVLALNRIKLNKGLDIYNLGTGVGYSVLDIVNTFMKVNNINIPYKLVGRRPGDIATCYADPSKAKEELNFETKLTLEDMCRDSYNFERNLTLNNK